MKHDTTFYLFVCCWHENFFLLDKPKSVMLVEGADFGKVAGQLKKGDGIVPTVKEFGSREAALKEFKENKDYEGASIKDMSFGEGSFASDMKPKETTEPGSSIPYKKEKLADRENSWDGDKNQGLAWDKDGPKGMKRMHAWYDSKNPENKTAYKLPHHEYADGQYRTSWRGVVAAMQALLGARGGVDIPENERKGVYDHLARHYKDFDEEPPEFKQ